MHKRDFLKRKAALAGDPLIWDQFRHARNYTNNEIRKAKRKYFTEYLEISKSDSRKNMEPYKWIKLSKLQQIK